VPVPAGGGGLIAGSAGELVFPLTEAYVSDVLLVGDEAIRQARRALWRAARLVAEPAAAVTCAALISGAYRPAPGERVAAVTSGANTDPATANPSSERAGMIPSERADDARR
jgi:threonine dehydratase